MAEQDKRAAEVADQDEAVEESRNDGVDIESVDVVAQLLAEAERQLAEVERQLAEAERQLAAANNRALRAQAELENTRKRTGKEIERIRQYSLESFASALLEVKDNLERSLENHGAIDIEHQTKAVTLEDICEGVGLTLKLLQRVFSDFGIEELAPLEQSFDPEFHQAISTLKTADYPPNTVIELTQKGYALNGRLLRAAMVVVSAAPDEGTGGAAEPAGAQSDTGEAPSEA